MPHLSRRVPSQLRPCSSSPLAFSSSHEAPQSVDRQRTRERSAHIVVVQCLEHGSRYPRSGPNQKSTPNWVSCRTAARAVRVSVYRAAARCGALMEIMLDMLDMLDMRDEQGRSKHSKPNS